MFWFVCRPADCRFEWFEGGTRRRRQWRPPPISGSSRTATSTKDLYIRKTRRIGHSQTIDHHYYYKTGKVRLLGVVCRIILLGLGRFIVQVPVLPVVYEFESKTLRQFILYDSVYSIWWLIMWCFMLMTHSRTNVNRSEDFLHCLFFKINGILVSIIFLSILVF